MNTKIRTLCLVLLAAFAALAMFCAVLFVRGGEAEAAQTFFRVDSGDEAWGLNPSQSDERMRTYWEGSGAVRTYGGKYMTNCFGSLEKAVNVGVTGLSEETAALGMWLYVNDVQRITGDAAIEITSSGECDKGEYQWSVPQLIADGTLRSGWNWLELPVASAAKNENGVTPDLDNINFMRIYNFGTNVAMMLDDVILYDSSAYAPTEDDNFVRTLPENENFVSGDVLLDSCDTGVGTPDSENKQEGAASGSITGSGMLIMEHVLPAPVDTKMDVYRANLVFDLYIDDVTALDTANSGSYNVIEVTSSGRCDADEYEFDLTALALIGVIRSGWNHVTIPFAATQLFASDNDMINKTTGTPDLSALNYIRLLTNGTERTVKLDNVRVVDRDWTPPAPPPEHPEGFVRISDCDSAWGLNPSQSAKYGSTYWQGTGAVRSYTGKNSYDNALSMETTFDAGVTGYAEESAALGLWLYINDVNTLVPTQSAMIELTSGGTFDADEYEWALLPMAEAGTLQSGWNWLELPLSAAKKTGSPDLDALNYMRIYMHGTNLLVMADDVILYDAEEYVPTADENYVRTLPASDADAPDYVILDDCDNVWDGGTADAQDAQQGKGCVSVSGSDELIVSKRFAAADTGLTMHDAVLDFWLYVSDVTAMTQFAGDVYNVIEVTSSGTCDADEVELNLTTLMLDGRIVDGWNHVQVPFAAALAWQGDNDMINKTTGNPDLSALNYVRLLTRGNERTVKIDCVAVKKASYTGEIVAPVASVLLDAGTPQTGWEADRLEYRYGGQSVRAEGTSLSYARSGLNVGETGLNGTFGVSLWGYADKASALESWTVTLTDAAGKKAVWEADGLQDGWNWIALAYADAQTESGFDADAIDGFSVAVEASAPVTVRLNRVALINGGIAQNFEQPTDTAVPPQFSEDEDGGTYDPVPPADPGKDNTAMIVLCSVAGVLLVATAIAFTVVLIKKKKAR